MPIVCPDELLSDGECWNRSITVKECRPQAASVGGISSFLVDIQTWSYPPPHIMYCMVQHIVVGCFKVNNIVCALFSCSWDINMAWPPQTCNKLFPTWKTSWNMAWWSDGKREHRHSTLLGGEPLCMCCISNTFSICDLSRLLVIIIEIRPP